MNYGFYTSVYNYNTRRRTYGYQLGHGVGLSDSQLAKLKEEWDERIRELDQKAFQRAVTLARLSPEGRVRFLQEEQQKRYRQQWDEAEQYDYYEGDEYYDACEFYDGNWWEGPPDEYDREEEMRAWTALEDLQDSMREHEEMQRREEARQLEIEILIYEIQREPEKTVPVAAFARRSRRLLPDRWRSA